MTRAKPTVFITRKLPDVIETRMMELFDARLNVEDRPLAAAEIIAGAQAAEVLVPTVTDRIDAAVIAAAGPRLKLIASFGAGVDHLDVAAAHARDIVVTNTPGVLTEDTADVAMALILAVARRVCEGDRLVRRGDWAGWAPTAMLGMRLAGKRLGIIGMGRIGMALARRARAFGLAVHYHNRRRLAPALEEALEASYWESLDQMLARMDILSVNCPRTPATYHLLSARRLRLIRRDAILINTSRGETVDEAELIRRLVDRAIAGAGFDVYENEPAVNPKLLGLETVVLLPHLGSATLEARIDMGEKVIVNMKTFIDGHAPPDRVFESML